MSGADRLVERVEIVWVVGCFITAIYAVHNIVSDYQLGPYPGLTRFFSSATLGSLLGAYLSIAGLPVIHLAIRAYNKLITKGRNGRTKPYDTANAR